ncbi:MAG: hypothetical protein C0518_07170 [Opitutus sp.]|nr:hypothetical protein [Opitutus sp.]
MHRPTPRFSFASFHGDASGENSSKRDLRRDGRTIEAVVFEARQLDPDVSKAEFIQRLES